MYTGRIREQIAAQIDAQKTFAQRKAHIDSCLLYTSGPPDGQYAQALIQPAGVIRVKLTLDQGQVTQVSIGGPVSLDSAISVQVPL